MFVLPMRKTSNFLCPTPTSCPSTILTDSQVILLCKRHICLFHLCTCSVTPAPSVRIGRIWSVTRILPFKCELLQWFPDESHALHELGQLGQNLQKGNADSTVKRRSPRSVMVNVQDCDIVVSKFELQSHYYVHFWINKFGKAMKLHSLPVIGWIVALLDLIMPLRVK